uniref:CP-type G domain-containing protein n=1 Tax=Mucochytrium quahogii TaxID=96639 RepID=A0A7S2WHR1_9STRA|mmetsp:Transcript_20778/g.34351  ORF Transcript_20778/g.34351 Transcript_20778/m.34351 type:complete len:595 (+) Transcript_20778:161-1945(+)|eukprot:CAMPEP_0203750970 /NCGR_PEP_ID=MMETSP0098-20131031/5114_1 /ASSEMBLY_ACC=CAM_ASM_000208 /TAXON_ID=96639 /ORGANISM=" , Strain NY0313808BC1" /LENGTH=594 /DNA_ID=CAMNT_0050640487 /DNA_START=155 /DNA_END=1939 /DNA_ORIENTATION=+
MAKGKKSKNGALGKSLSNAMRRSKTGKRKNRQAMEREDEAIAALGFQSVVGTSKSITETGELESFLAEAVMSGRKFEAVRQSRVIDLGSIVEDAPGVTNEELENRLDSDGNVLFDFRDLPIPRRPAWTREMTAEELDRKEKDNFLRWRRSIADLESRNNELQVTPFEKNIDYWRQLWRVVERSDVVVQVVDARNPLLFRCADLEKFAVETGEYKMNLLLVNKADFLTLEERQAWRVYFDRKKIPFLFFSAKEEQEKLNQNILEEGIKEGIALDHSMERLVTRSELQELLERLAGEIKNKRPVVAGRKESKATVGMLGYPNVGKSSVINVIFGVTSTDHTVQRVSVAATPGHTKHFQTLHLSDETILCDCPGLVFPTFMNTKADLLCNGILPIDEIRGRDFFPAVQVICRCIPREAFEKTYALKFPLAESITVVPASMLLETFCEKRGLKGSGVHRYNEAYGARVLLKNFVSGKLVYCCPPPREGDFIKPLPKGPVDESILIESDLVETMEDQLLLHDEQLVYSETQKMEKDIPLSRTKKKTTRHTKRGKQERLDNPYAEGEFFGVKVGGKKNNTKGFTRVQRPWDNVPNAPTNK